LKPWKMYLGNMVSYEMKAYEIYLIKSTNNNLNVIPLLLLSNSIESNQNNLLFDYFDHDNNNVIEIIDYLMKSDIKLFHTIIFKNKMIDIILIKYFNNRDIEPEIIKKLIEHKELQNHTIVIHNENYNIMTHYIISSIKNKIQINTNILVLLLMCGYSPFITSNKFNNYRHNALLLYLKKLEFSVETCENAFEIINILMNKEYSNFISPETVLYKKGRVYNILTWYLTNVKEPNIKIIDHLLTKGVNIHFIDNRSNNISELYLLFNKQSQLEILKYLYEKKVKFNEYCLCYYFQTINPKDYQEQIVEYLLKICQLCDHNSWININDGEIYKTLSLYFSHLEQVKTICNNDVSKNYFKLYCCVS